MKSEDGKRNANLAVLAFFAFASVNLSLYGFKNRVLGGSLSHASGDSNDFRFGAREEHFSLPCEYGNDEAFEK